MIGRTLGLPRDRMVHGVGLIGAVDHAVTDRFGTEGDVPATTLFPHSGQTLLVLPVRL